MIITFISFGDENALAYDLLTQNVGYIWNNLLFLETLPLILLFKVFIQYHGYGYSANLGLEAKILARRNSNLIYG